ncbi:hypothetical protein Dsin_007817 [Dipteronia sinensis]|uniref:Uncharacterized protein n=1 Tax=Dipteronia sinensis TaxID=43782 RepID=A0AAE0B269_9ROSI|nr:hypothetical protein Dsin_007817 [Dipteronia sinensis]
MGGIDHDQELDPEDLLVNVLTRRDVRHSKIASLGAARLKYYGLKITLLIAYVKQLTFTFPEDATTSNGSIHFTSRNIWHPGPIPAWAKYSTKLADAINKVIVPDFHPRRM